jgi:hypothetical protein
MRPILPTLALALALGTAAFAQTAATTLTLEAPPTLAQGEATVLRAILTDAAGAPVTGQSVDFHATLPFFDYVSTTHLGTARTNFRGEATLPFTPTVEGRRTFTATFDGATGLAPAAGRAPFTVTAGTLAAASRPPAPVLPWLTRGRATAFLLPAMLGVWVIFGYAIYQMTRIAREGRREPDSPAAPAKAVPTA